jgi:hypothetical protein
MKNGRASKNEATEIKTATVAVYGRASNGALPFCFDVVAEWLVGSYYLVTPEHRNRHAVVKSVTTLWQAPPHHPLLRFRFFNDHTMRLEKHRATRRQPEDNTE